MDYARKPLADALAAEYVAGTLRGPARRRFEALLPGHPLLQGAVRDWQARLMPLTLAVVDEDPPARVWQRVEQRLWPDAPARPWWRGLVFWRTASALATVAAISFALLLASPQPGRAPVLVVLQSTGADGRLASDFIASVGGDGRSLVTRPIRAVALEPGRVLELWSLPPAGQPRSLGLINANGTTVLTRERLPASLLKGGTAALAVSIEPPGGSPTGVPTGPVVYAGKLTL